MTEFSHLFAALGEVTPDFRVDLRPEFGSTREGHRAAIRAALATALGDPALTDLNILPAPAAWSVSISHAAPLGGWLAVPRPNAVGFDLEVRDRVRLPTVQRICTAEELALTDDVAALWCAKEALFKASARGRVATLSQLKVAGWTPRGAVTLFRGENDARGAVATAEGLTAAWAILGPQIEIAPHVK